MKVVGRDRLRAFGEKHADARKWIEGWVSDVELSTWTTPQDVKDRYASASFLQDGVVIFNVKGNRYRLEANIAYQTKIVVVKWIGTHGDYDKRNEQR
ncbi:MAG: type II toxin-antitoxin system HigB family toxin [Erysipelotrichales bacterium]|nr:MAG: type II toxin-antitoxin system HigB family toxin [Erysipelotrichales bacterium]